MFFPRIRLLFQPKTKLRQESWHEQGYAAQVELSELFLRCVHFLSQSESQNGLRHEDSELDDKSGQLQYKSCSLLTELTCRRFGLKIAIPPLDPALQNPTQLLVSFIIFLVLLWQSSCNQTLSFVFSKFLNSSSSVSLMMWILGAFQVAGHRRIAKTCRGIRFYLATGSQKTLKWARNGITAAIKAAWRSLCSQWQLGIEATSTITLTFTASWGKNRTLYPIERRCTALSRSSCLLVSARYNCLDKANTNYVQELASSWLHTPISGSLLEFWH